MTEQTFAAPLEPLRKRKQEATARLLGDTIGISDDDWNRPSLLPGWSRAHVAAHLAANAEALARLVENVSQNPGELYPDEDSRLSDIEYGSSLTGLELQICLDTTAGRLARALDAVDDWTTPVELLGRSLSLAQVPMVRLSEVVLHHLDLDCDFSVDWLEPAPARWLLQWTLEWHDGDWELPPLLVQSTSGISGELGGAGEVRRTVSGDDAELWAWLMGRTSGDHLEGADGLVPALRS